MLVIGVGYASESTQYFCPIDRIYKSWPNSIPDLYSEKPSVEAYVTYV